MAIVGYLKQSTAATLAVGPFIDDTDGKTAETALTLTQADFQVSKNGAAFAQKNESTSGTHMTLGYYSVPIDTTDTATLGRLCVAVHESGALPVRMDFCVLAANVFDSLIGGTDLFDVSVTQIAGTTVSTSTAQLGVNMVNVAGAAVSTTTAQIGTNVVSHTTGAVPFKKNTALSAFMFYMSLTSGAAGTGLTVSVTRSIDGAAFGAGTLGSVAEVANGWYKLDLGAGDLNGTVIVLKATATGANQRNIEIMTSL